MATESGVTSVRFSTITYNIGQGLKNIWRNKLFSLASIATMTACIFLLGLFYSIGANFSKTVHTAEEGVAVTVFFDAGISQEQIENIGNEIKKRGEVREVKFVSAEEAWDTFKVEYFKGREELAEGFVNDNPLANQANYEIYLNDVSMQSTLVSYLESLDGVRQVNQSEVVAETLSDVNKLISLIFVSFIVILIAIAIFLISNTITTGIAVRKEEIAIMKLIGAKDSFVRAPFIVEGIAIGLIGSIIPLVILLFMYKSVMIYVTEKFVFLTNFLTFIPVNDIFRVLVPVALVLGIGIGYIGSRMTLKKHLKV